MFKRYCSSPSFLSCNASSSNKFLRAVEREEGRGKWPHKWINRLQQINVVIKYGVSHLCREIWTLDSVPLVCSFAEIKLFLFCNPLQMEMRSVWPGHCQQSSLVRLTVIWTYRQRRRTYYFQSCVPIKPFFRGIKYENMQPVYLWTFDLTVRFVKQTNYFYKLFSCEHLLGNILWLHINAY